MKQVLFICVHNSGRSQMAEAFFNRLAGNKATATSAGTNPAKEIDATVAQAMLEVGIDISHQKPKQLTFEMMNETDRAITMGCGVEGVCPASFVPTEDWEAGRPAWEAVRRSESYKRPDQSESGSTD
jgi:arsenate reductase